VSSAWRPTSSGLARAPLTHFIVPPDYERVIATIGAGEGFVGQRFLRMYPPEELAALNEAYAVQTFLPNHQIFGSDGAGSAFLFEVRAQDVAVVEYPFIPLDAEYLTARHANFFCFSSDRDVGSAGIRPSCCGPPNARARTA
jgi:hypothetical protein